ncbi:YrzA family protein [Cytobacillus suaedae]|nr:YrzA family protein [Cytobacillus suaedae]
MEFKLDFIQDKVEFFESYDLVTLEKNINEKIEHNQAILLEVHRVSHQMYVDEDGRRYFTAVVHFKAKK